MIDPRDELYKDIEAVRKIPIVPTMLDVICQTTGMGFAAVARVTADRWVACSVRDEVQFGLEEGGELEIQTTLCNEIRESRQPIVIDHVANDPFYQNHHTPKIYGLQSYISIPIILRNGTFFGTLCAIDSKPAQVNNPKVIGTFTMFAELLAFHLETQDLLQRSYTTNVELSQRNQTLSTINFDLDTLVYTASHDLKSPIANIESLLEALLDALAKESIDREEVKQIGKLMQTSISRFSRTVNDLTKVIEADRHAEDEGSEEIDIRALVETVKQDLQHAIEETEAHIEVQWDDSVKVHFSRKNLKSIVYNLVSNALKYRSPERTPEILVNVAQVDGKTQLSVTDNGMGIPAENQDKVFKMFKRLHDHVEGTGVGLYIVKRIVDNRKGEIKIGSTLGKGTTFTVIF